MAFRTPSDQYRAAASNYDNASPSVPAYDAFDADADVAADLVKADEVHELVTEVRESLGLLRWLADQSIPAIHLPAYRELLRKAEALDKAVDAKLDNWRALA